jgi:hypothetical protein
MPYSYDRTASGKVWHEYLADAQEEFMGDTVKELAKLLKGEGRTGAFGSGSVTYGKGVVRLGFAGGSVGTVYVVAGPKEKRTEHSVVNHTPESFAAILVNRGTVPA